MRPEQSGGYVTGVIATLVAIGGLYLADKLRATTAMAVVAAGTIAIWLARSSFRLITLRATGDTGSCIPEGLEELWRSWPVVLAAVPPVLALAGAAAKLWSVTLGLHLGSGGRGLRADRRRVAHSAAAACLKMGDGELCGLARGLRTARGGA